MTKLKTTIVILITAVALCSNAALAQHTFVIKGKVTETDTTEPLIGASVRCGTAGAATDVDGNYELSVKVGCYDIECSYIGFENDRRRITVSCDTVINFELKSVTSELSEVVVLSRSVMDRLKNTQPGMERIDIDEMSKTPVLFGVTIKKFPCGKSMRKLFCNSHIMAAMYIILCIIGEDDLHADRLACL